jgi:hypothetical protein
MVFCGKCGEQRNFPMSSIRASRAPCEICGGFDKINVERRGGRIEERNLPNYSYPDHLLPTVVEREEVTTGE